MKGIISSAIGMLALACWSTTSLAAISSFVVTGATVSKSTGAVTVTGTIVCTLGHGVAIFGNLIQIKGPHFAMTGGFTLGSCSGGTDPWTALNFTFIGTVQPGNAIVQAFAMDTTDLTEFPNPTTKVVVRPVP